MTSAAPSYVDRLRAAIHRTQSMVRNARIDLKYGSALAVERRTNGLSVGLRNSDYSALEQIFENRIRPDDVLVDVGSAGGRVINFWLETGCANRIVGIEFDPVLADRCRRRLADFGNVEIVTGDATRMLPDDATLIYLFNPFGPEVLSSLRDRVAELPGGADRPQVVYYNSRHLDVWEHDDRFEVERVTLDAPPYAPLSPLAIVTRR